MDQEMDVYDEAAQQVVELANRLAERDSDADLWDIADGLLTGVVHYWLYSRQPCENLLCEECEPISTAPQRLAELLRTVEELARESEYYHSAHDTNLGRA